MSAHQVLFVDDEENILNAMERLFLGSDIRVLKATDSGQALDILQHEQISVVVSDYRMPGMHGVDLLDRVRLLYPEISKILMTAHADLSMALDAINRGEVFRFICKPWNDQELVQAVEDAVGRNALCRALQSADENTLLTLAQAIELKDPYTRGHCERLAEYALGLAATLGLESTQLKNLKIGSWLHDCGKIGVPEKILNFNGPLNESKFNIVRKHPLWGEDLAQKAHLSQDVREIILFHHERYDGKGYPHRLKGEEIPFLTRIVTIADIYDAIRSDRPYKPGLPVKETTQMMSDMAGVMIDPALTETFLKLIDSDYFTTEKQDEGRADD